MSQKELAERMLLPVKLIRVYEKRNIDPPLHYHASFRSIFKVTNEDINRLKTTGGK
ncbi:Cro/Cl family transcriptional regulator [Enterococcus hirae]|uniref:Cro/Cl family transcriptional regulator n=1 Tax=Enterococcus hirae TaxID=1354 RepID=UPI0020730B6E|nr:Cro/Cl family transcriptional regulator [Enterococcus hirae]